MTEQRHPHLRQVLLDATDARTLAEFYRALLGYEYRPGDEPPPAAEPDPKSTDWLALRDPQGRPGLAFQQVDELPRSTWLADGVPQQLHLDTTGLPKADLDAEHELAMSLGATVLLDRSEDAAGHPFCIFVSSP